MRALRTTLLAATAALALTGGTIAPKPYTFSPYTQALSSQVNADFDTLYNFLLYPNIDSANIDATGINASQIIPRAPLQATFGGTQGYTFPQGGDALTFSAPSADILWQSGVAAPTVGTRSAGTRLVLYPAVGPNSLDFGLGIESGGLWSSVGVGGHFTWYTNAGTTGAATLATLDSNGFLSTSSFQAGGTGGNCMQLATAPNGSCPEISNSSEGGINYVTSTASALGDRWLKNDGQQHYTLLAALDSTGQFTPTTLKVGQIATTQLPYLNTAGYPNHAGNFHIETDNGASPAATSYTTGSYVDAVTVTFANDFMQVPSCVVSLISANYSGAIYPSTVTVHALTVSGSGTGTSASARFHYQCIGI